MTTTDPILRAVQAAIAEVNAFLPADQALDASPESLLVTRLDSLGLVNLLLGTESQVEQSTGRTVSLTDLLAVDAEESPLATVASFVALVRARLDEAAS